MISNYVKINVLPQLIAGIETLPIKKAWLFGSCSRGEETKDSDVDVLVQYEDGARISLLRIGHFITVLQNRINRRVDLVEDGQLLPFAVPSVNTDKILIYERKNQGQEQN